MPWFRYVVCVVLASTLALPVPALARGPRTKAPIAKKRGTRKARPARLAPRRVKALTGRRGTRTTSSGRRFLRTLGTPTSKGTKLTTRAVVRRAQKSTKRDAQRRLSKDRRKATAKKTTKKQTKMQRARAAAQRIKKRWGKKTPGVLSTVGTAGLLMLGARVLHRSASLGRAGSSILGVIAPAALAIGSLFAIRHSSTWTERNEGIHGLLWAKQGSLELAGASVTEIARGVGVAGGSLQSAIGVSLIARGLKHRDKHMIIAGSLDLAAGVSWVAGSLAFAEPISMGIFISASVAKFVHANRDGVNRLARRVVDGARSLGTRAGVLADSNG